jgi:hypothetical protein
VDGKWVKLEKFSSMGNGYTFELETTIFAAIAMAVMPESVVAEVDVFVYGDDIIVPKEHAEDVLAALKFCGFTPNKRKTFVEGPFRESCGGDSFLGAGVRPYYLKDEVNEPQHWIALANGLYRSSHQNGDDDRYCRRLRRAWFRCLDRIPNTIRQCRGPEGLGDLVVQDGDERRWSVRWRGSIRYVRVYRPVQRPDVAWAGFGSEVQFAAALYGVPRYPMKVPKTFVGHGDDPKGLLSRKAVTGYKVGWVPFS